MSKKLNIKHQCAVHDEKQRAKGKEKNYNNIMNLTSATNIGTMKKVNKKKIKRREKR